MSVPPFMRAEREAPAHHGGGIVQERVPRSDRFPVVGYVVRRWPDLSEPYVVNEIQALERLGAPMRIFSLADEGTKARGKGASVRARVTYLAARHQPWTVLCSNLRVAFTRPARYTRLFVWSLLQRRQAVRSLFQAAHLACLLREEPLARLHAHSAEGPALVSMFVHELTGVPYTFTAHPGDVSAYAQPRLLRAEVARAEAVITLCEDDRQYVSDQVDPAERHKLSCIYSGIDLRRFPYRSPADAEREPGLVLSVGRLTEHNGFEDLLAAADMLRRMGKEFRLEIIGDGPLRGALEAEVRRLNLQSRVTLRGEQPPDIVQEAYRRATAFVLPCVVTPAGDCDGIPTVLMEAMASGLPVISTAILGIPELINAGREGTVVAPHDPVMLSRVIDRVLNDLWLRERLASAARGKIEERFTIERTAVELLVIFRQKPERRVARQAAVAVTG